MATDVSGFRARFPELSNEEDGTPVPDATIQLYLDEAHEAVNVSVCPKFADAIEYNLAAHLMAKSGNNPQGMDDNAGPASANTVGSVSQTLQVSGSSNGDVSSDYYRSTPYGQQYLLLIKKCFGGSATVVP